MPRDPRLGAGPGHHAVMRREDGEERDVPRQRQRQRPRRRGRRGQPDQDEVRAGGERRHEDRATQPGNGESRARRSIGGRHGRVSETRIIGTPARAGLLTSPESASTCPTPRIVISGIGVVSTFGVGRDVFWDHIVARGERHARDHDVRRLGLRLPGRRRRAAGRHVGGGRGRGRGRRRLGSRAPIRGATRAPRSSASIAGREAWRDAGLRVGEPGAGRHHRQRRRRHRRRRAAVPATSSPTAAGRSRPTPSPIGICGMVSSEISISLGLRGVSHVLSTGCTSSTDAIGYAAALLRAGDADVVLSGGTDGCVLPGMIFGFSRMRVVSTHYNDRPAEASRPFDRGRDGFVLGEGAWMVVLEREDRARARGARIYATIDGYASTCDAYHRVQMDPDGDRDRPLHADRGGERSGRALDEIGYVNYHGTSTQLNDAVEARCTRRVFGALAERLAGSSTKSMIGHPQGASGAAGVVTTRAGARPRLPAADHQPRRSGSGLRSRLPAERRAAPRGRRRRSATVSASDRRTARWCWERWREPAPRRCRRRRRRPGRGDGGAAAGASRLARAAVRSRPVPAAEAVRRHARTRAPSRCSAASRPGAAAARSASRFAACG